MGRKGKSEEQVIALLREVEGGKTVVEVCRRAGISSATYYSWKKQYAGMGIAELRELRQLREEVGQLKRLVADLSLDRHILQEIVKKSCEGLPASRVGPVGSSSIRDQRAAGVTAFDDRAQQLPVQANARSAR